MRAIGSIQEESQARVFSFYLYFNGIDNQIEADEKGGWNVWVLSEDQIDASKKLLNRYKEFPEDPEYARAYHETIRRLKEERVKAARSRTRYIDVRTTWNQAIARGIAPLTGILIGASVLVFLLMIQHRDKVLWVLSIAPYEIRPTTIGYIPNLLNIRQGEIWRLFTPMFIHFGFIHLLFNLLWLKDLGSAIERRHGKMKFIIMVLAICALSNLAQYWDSGPSFGGMSGVVFGLLGYIWMRGKFDPASGFRVPRVIVIMMAGWFIICFIGLIPNIANTAHAVGLGLGLLFGLVSSGRLGSFSNRSG